MRLKPNLGLDPQEQPGSAGTAPPTPPRSSPEQHRTPRSSWPAQHATPGPETLWAGLQPKRGLRAGGGWREARHPDQGPPERGTVPSLHSEAVTSPQCRLASPAGPKGT